MAWFTKGLEKMNSFGTLTTIDIGGKTYHYHSLALLEKKLGLDLSRMPYGLRVLLENLLRYEDGEVVKKSDIEALVKQDPKKESDHEIQFTPGRVLLQDFTGVPVVADLGAMRAAMVEKKGVADKVNPLQPVDLVIDHSVQVDFYGDQDALAKNSKLEFERNQERYEFLKWGQKAFRNFQVVPPATGICHQVNLEFLAHVAMLGELRGQTYVYPDTVVGTDSHTPMVNALGVVGWGVGGIEAEAAMLGQPCTMLIPQVVGFEMTGKLSPVATATDLVLTVTQMLRKKGVVGKFVEYFGEGVSTLSVADRATISNMSPEYGATIGIFPVDAKTIEYLKTTGRTERAERAEAYYRAQGLFVEGKQKPASYSDVLTLDLSKVEPSMAGPSKPHDRSTLSQVRGSFRRFLASRFTVELQPQADKVTKWTEDTSALKEKSIELAKTHPDAAFGSLGTTVPVTDPKGNSYHLAHGSVVIAAITSCTNTSNPDLMIGAAILARNAIKKGLKVKPWVKTSFAPGSKVVTDYLLAAGLNTSLDALGFNLVGYGCTTCIGNAGPLPPHIQAAVDKGNLATTAVLSGNRNFEARIHPSVLGNYLASPPLVVAFALAGNIQVNLATEPVGYNDKGEGVMLKDIWPDRTELASIVMKYVTSAQFKKAYGDVFTGEELWQKTVAPTAATYAWSDTSTYIKKPPFFDPNLIEEAKASEVRGARILGLFGDFITTDHISPAGNIGKTTPAGKYLVEKGVDPTDFNSYGARRGNHEVMIRGTFANVRIKNKMVDKEGGLTKVYPDAKEQTIYDAAQEYHRRHTPLVVFAGKEYGSGSSRDWAAKGTRLLGVRAVVAESFERIHRSNLVGMGVLPIQLPEGIRIDTLGLKGDEEIDIAGLDKMTPKSMVEIVIRKDGKSQTVKAQVRIDTPNELKYFRSGGILPFVLDRLANR
jgi:aconitate hydratase